MDTITTPTEATAPETTPAKPARKIKTPAAVKAKTAVKPKPVKAEAPKVEAESSRVNPHVAAGLDVTLYTGLSSYVNANRKVAVRRDVTATTDDMTDRMKRGLYALRKAYGDKPWRAKGFDNGILAHLAAAGLISFSGGHEQVIDGHKKLTDGEQPVVARVTKLGMTYGVA